MVIKGIDVILHTKVVTGVDPFGNQITADIDVTVSNVLVTPAGAEDVLTEVNLSGKRIAYNLCIPKGDTNEWEGATVTFFGRTFRCIGIAKEYIEAMLPLQWNKQIQVECYE